MKSRIVLLTITLILCFGLIQGPAWSEPAPDCENIPQSQTGNPKSDWHWQVGSHEVTLSAPQGVSFAAPVYWGDPGSNPAIWTQTLGSDSPMEVFVKPSPDAQVNVIAQLVGEPVLAVQQHLQQEGRLTASALHRQRADRYGGNGCSPHASAVRLRTTHPV